MKLQTKICLSMLFLFSISLVSSLTIYSGDSVEIVLSEPYDYYSVAGNSSEVVLDIVQNGNNVTITPSKYSLEDEYEVIFFNVEKEVITIHTSSGGGGGSSSTKYIYENVTEYVDREVVKEVPGETKEVEKTVKEVPLWVWILIGLLIAFVLAILFTKNKEEPEEEVPMLPTMEELGIEEKKSEEVEEENDHTDERRLEENE